MRTFKILFMTLLSGLLLLPGVRCMAQVEMLHLKSMPDTVLPQMQLHKANSALGARHVKTMPAFDLQKLLEEDKQRDELREAVRYGKAFDVSYTLKDGEWKDVEGGRLWGMQVASPGARLLTFFIEDISLPDSAYIFIVNDDASVLYGNITGKILNKERCVLTDFIPGSKATVYLFEPAKYKGLSKFRISRVVHGFRDIATDGNAPDLEDESLNGASSCNIDIACKPAYADESNAVAQMFDGSGIFWGTCALVMTGDGSFEPYLLTAFHCLDSDYNQLLSAAEINAIASWCFKFKYRKTSCSGTFLATSLTFTGANVVAARNEYHSDFALLKLTGRPKDIPDMYFLGWDCSDSTPTSGTCIHHPQGDVMKISIDNNTLQSTIWGGQSQVNNRWRVDFDEGVGEPGSSGAPLLDQNKRIVGQLSEGINHMNPCENTNAQFGKFSLSWLGGGTNVSQLKHWLDPDNTGVTYIDGSYSPEIQPSIEGNTVLCSSGSYTLNGMPSTCICVWSLSNNSNFLLLDSGDTICYVTYLGNAEVSTTLTARIYYGSILIKTVNKTIYHHTTPIISGSQQAGYGSGHFFDARDNILPFTDPDTGITYYEVSPCSDIALYAEAFRGMQLGYYGETPTTWDNYDNVINLSLPYHSTPYDFHITGESVGHCSDFNITLRVDTTSVQPQPEGLTVYFEGEYVVVYLGYESVVGNPSISFPAGSSWHLTAQRLGSSVLVYNGIEYEQTACIPKSAFLSGYYYAFRGYYEGNVFTCTALIP